MYCTNCLKPCDTITTEIGPFLAELSDCCAAEIGPHAPHEPFCCFCEEPGPIRCTQCGEWYCAKCFGPDRAEAGGPCHDCAVKLAREGIY
jgi:hypothetical protein